MNNNQKQQGFSLIELSIVIIVSGFLFSTAVTAYKHYLEKKIIYSTQAKIDTINKAMDRFFGTYGRYPCPASLTLGPADAGFGEETDCDLAPAVGTFVSIGLVNDDDDLTTFVNIDIRKGAIPFKTLKIGTSRYGRDEYQYGFDIGAEDVTDFYKNKFTYILTEDQGTDKYVPRLGAIQIRDEHNSLLSENPIKNHADYVVVSHGKNDAGAYDLYGNLIGGGCLASLPANENENCDNDDTYVASLRYDAGVNQYDDHLVYRTWANYYLWDLASVDRTNIYNLNTGNVGVGKTDPQAKLHVYDGNAVADEGVGTVTDASILANEYCGFDPLVDGVGEDCFKPEIIAGSGLDCDVDLDNIGTHAPGRTAMSAIQNSTLDCQTIYDVSQAPAACPAGQFISGISYDAATKTLVTTCRAL